MGIHLVTVAIIVVARLVLRTQLARARAK